MRRVLMLLVAALALSGCTTGEATSDRRVVAAAAGVAAMIDELGLGEEVVGVDERNAAGDFADLPVVTNGHELNLEVLLSTQPTLVLLDELVGPASVRDDLEQRGIATVVLDTAASLQDIETKYLRLGKVLGVPAAAEQARAAFATRLQEFSGASGSSWRIAFLYLRGTNAIYLVGGKGSGADSLIAAVGSVDVGAELLDTPFTPLSAEIMAQLDPQVLLVMTDGLASVGGVDGLRALPGIAQTEAGRTGRVVAVPDTQLLEFGPDTIAVLASISKQLAALS